MFEVYDVICVDVCVYGVFCIYGGVLFGINVMLLLVFDVNG